MVTAFHLNKPAATAQLVERRVSDRKVSDSRFDSGAGKASLCPWKRHFTHISHWGQAVHPVLKLRYRRPPIECWALEDQRENSQPGLTNSANFLLKTVPNCGEDIFLGVFT